MSTVPIHVADTNSIDYVIQQAQDEYNRNDITYRRGMHEQRCALVQKYVNHLEQYLTDRGIRVPPVPITSPQQPRHYNCSVTFHSLPDPPRTASPGVQVPSALVNTMVTAAAANHLERDSAETPPSPYLPMDASTADSLRLASPAAAVHFFTASSEQSPTPKSQIPPPSHPLSCDASHLHHATPGSSGSPRLSGQLSPSTLHPQRQQPASTVAVAAADANAHPLYGHNTGTYNLGGNGLLQVPWNWEDFGPFMNSITDSSMKGAAVRPHHLSASQHMTNGGGHANHSFGGAEDLSSINVDALVEAARQRLSVESIRDPSTVVHHASQTFDGCPYRSDLMLPDVLSVRSTEEPQQTAHKGYASSADPPSVTDGRGVSLTLTSAIDLNLASEQAHERLVAAGEGENGSTDGLASQPPQSLLTSSSPSRMARLTTPPVIEVESFTLISPTSKPASPTAAYTGQPPAHRSLCLLDLDSMSSGCPESTAAEAKEILIRRVRRVLGEVSDPPQTASACSSGFEGQAGAHSLPSDINFSCNNGVNPRSPTAPTQQPIINTFPRNPGTGMAPYPVLQKSLPRTRAKPHVVSSVVASILNEGFSPKSYGATSCPTLTSSMPSRVRSAPQLQWEPRSRSPVGSTHSADDIGASRRAAIIQRMLAVCSSEKRKSY